MRYVHAQFLNRWFAVGAQREQDLWCAWDFCELLAQPLHCTGDVAKYQLPFTRVAKSILRVEMNQHKVELASIDNCLHNSRDQSTLFDR